MLDFYASQRTWFSMSMQHSHQIISDCLLVDLLNTD